MGPFSQRGGTWAGYATLPVGLGVWAYGTWIGGWTCPYLLSLIAALGTFGCAVAAESWSAHAPRRFDS